MSPSSSRTSTTPAAYESPKSNTDCCCWRRGCATCLAASAGPGREGPGRLGSSMPAPAASGAKAAVRSALQRLPARACACVRHGGGTAVGRAKAGTAPRAQQPSRGRADSRAQFKDSASARPHLLCCAHTAVGRQRAGRSAHRRRARGVDVGACRAWRLGGGAGVWQWALDGGRAGES